MSCCPFSKWETSSLFQKPNFQDKTPFSKNWYIPGSHFQHSQHELCVLLLICFPLLLSESWPPSPLPCSPTTVFTLSEATAGDPRPWDTAGALQQDGRWQETNVTQGQQHLWALLLRILTPGRIVSELNHFSVFGICVLDSVVMDYFLSHNTALNKVASILQMTISDVFSF